jgi:hypothetical protein
MLGYHDPVYDEGGDPAPSYHDPIYDATPGYPQGIADDGGAPVRLTIAGAKPPFPWTGVVIAAIVAYVLTD